MKRWLRNLAVRLKLWVGVALEIDLPPEFIITEHAKERIKERFYIFDALKAKEDTYNAWHYGKPPAEWMRIKMQRLGLTKKYTYVFYEGCLYVFRILKCTVAKYGYAQKLLVTCYCTNRKGLNYIEAEEEYGK